MGWSSWYGFTNNIDEVMLRDMADGMVSSGLSKYGYEHIWIDDGWALARDNATGHVIVDDSLFPSGMKNLTSYVHSKGLKFGIYTSQGDLTCLGYQPTQPDRPGSCGFEAIDAHTYAVEWEVDQVKDDGCGTCGQPWKAMADALNATGRPVWFAIHAGTDANATYAQVANMWRVGGDLSAANYDMWLNRLDLATADDQAALTGPGQFPNPDFLEVGYTPRQPKGNANVQSLIERRSMFTMWAALPGPLILSADLRPGADSGGIDDQEIMDILTNEEVIAVNQDLAAQPVRPISNNNKGIEVWRKKLADPSNSAIILFNRNSTFFTNDTQPVNIQVSWDELGYAQDAKVTVRDLWAKKDLGVHQNSFTDSVQSHEAKIYNFHLEAEVELATY